MRAVLPKKLEAGRVRQGTFASDPSWGAYGQFFIQGPCGERLCIVGSGADPDNTKADGWEHVSVSTRRRCPNWIEMSFVKDLFWEPEDCVVQFHPPQSAYINNHAYCLHLWRSTKALIPLPPAILVGIKTIGLIKDQEQAHELWKAANL